MLIAEGEKIIFLSSCEFWWVARADGPITIHRGSDYWTQWVLNKKKGHKVMRWNFKGVWRRAVEVNIIKMHSMSV